MVLHHRISLHHTMCIMTRHNLSINTQVYLNIEQECRYPITPLECILDNLVVSTCFHWCRLALYTLES
jgi:hypothetical protein